MPYLKLSKLVILFFYFSTLSILSLSLSAAPIKPYIATYTASIAGQTGKARRVLKLIDGRYQLSMQASVSLLGINLATINESSTGLAQPNIKPDLYFYSLKSIKDRSKCISFDHEKGLATSTKNSKAPESVAINDNIYDPLSYQLKLRMDLKAGKKELTYAVVDGDKIDYRKFYLIKKQTRIKLGDQSIYDTIRLRQLRSDKSRVTELWLAPELDYLPVKLRQIEKGKEYTILLYKVRFLKPPE